MLYQRQTNMELRSNSTSIEQQQQQEEDETVDVQLRTQDQVNQACSGMNRPFSGIGGSVEDKVEINDDIESEEAGSSKRSSDSPRAIGGKTEALLRMESAGSQEEPTNRGDKEEEDKMNINRVDRLESMDENNLTTLAVVACEGKGEYFPEGEPDVEKAGPSVSYSRHAKEKGKEKALSDENFEGDENDDESFGSVESCNSAGLLSRGKKRPGFEQQLILGSKRLKTLSQECLGSTSKLKQDSSFMNWISNMTKGIWKGNEEDDSPFVTLTTTTSDANGHGHGHGQVNVIIDQQELNPCCVKESSGCRNTGFQSFFQSIYCPKKQSQDAVEMDISNDANPTSLQELPWIPEQCEITKEDHLSLSGNEIGPVAEPNISSGKDGFNQTSEPLSSENKHEDNKEPNISLMPLSKSKPNEEPKVRGEADGKVSPCVTNRNSGLESLWISRFSSKSSFPQKKASITTKEGNDSASDAAKARDSQIMLAADNVLKQNKAPTVSPMRIESSEIMASLFARKLEAVKRIIPSSLAENADEEQMNLICFYCGKKGHCLRDCLEVTDIELRDLVQNITARNRREEVSSLCIRCFQLSHWAATCPNAPLYSSGVEDKAIKHALASTSGSKLLPLTGFTDVPKAVFDAVQVLRLTRTHVLKWLNTKKTVSGLEGFFLRLRLGKWEEGLGGTGYYVARIDGATEVQSSRKHSESSSISVKVKGMTCLVESQFISNHDFLEEELKVWWRSVEKSTGRSGDGIPSAEELIRKIQQRKMLGF
ncbi:PREDICTED: uncharacterized protein LOC104771510 isoform X2 [Camelina sativa]|uniref:Uncharacterized protein LOC104771510 isoform X2 n=1 Tax=Camelina sativa TaxID=90675 RepID=A0ABM0Y278_CAMSA|nr:PREDICTED: uncharacterized protein LOC104771510 isoform X2 [Camelina sativa]